MNTDDGEILPESLPGYRAGYMDGYAQALKLLENLEEFFEGKFVTREEFEASKNPPLLASPTPYTQPLHGLTTSISSSASTYKPDVQGGQQVNVGNLPNAGMLSPKYRRQYEQEIAKMQRRLGPENTNGKW